MMPNFSDASVRTIRALSRSQAGKSEWNRIVMPCDLCGRRAIWEHPEGGLRCGKCPRPPRHARAGQKGGADGV